MENTIPIIEDKKLQLTQKEAIYQLVVSKINGRVKPLDQGMVDILTKEEKKAIRAELLVMIQKGEVKAKDSFLTAPNLSGRVSSLVSNWFKKDKRYY
jgi:hypothetical protein